MRGMEMRDTWHSWQLTVVYFNSQPDIHRPRRLLISWVSGSGRHEVDRLVIVCSNLAFGNEGNLLSEG